jgi:ribonuclease P protein component
LRRRAEFDRVFRQGRHNSGPMLAVRSYPNEAGLTRFAYSIPKRVGNAVARNRVRRRLREVVRSLPWREGFDVVIVARRETTQATFHSLLLEMRLLSRRGRLLDAP